MYERTRQARPNITAMPGVLYNELSSSESKTALSSCPVHDDSPLTVAPMNEDPCQVASLSPYYKDSHTTSQENVFTKAHTNGTYDEFHSLEGHSYMFTVHLSLSMPDYKTLRKFRMVSLMNKFHSETKIDFLVMKFKFTLF